MKELRSDENETFLSLSSYSNHKSTACFEETKPK